MNSTRFAILHQPISPDGKPGDYLVRIPLRVFQDGSFIGHCVVLPRVDAEIVARRKANLQISTATPNVISMDRVALERCCVLEIAAEHEAVMEAAMELAEKCCPTKSATHRTASGTALQVWHLFDAGREDAHRLRWEILSAYLAITTVGAEFGTEMGKWDRFYFWFVKDKKSPPTFEQFKKAGQEIGIRFKRKARGK